MTDQEWAGVRALLRANWPSANLPDFALAKWYSDLCDLPVQQVVAAVEAIARTGREFPPNGGQIRLEAVKQAVDAPAWGDMWQRILSAIRNFPFAAQADANVWLAEWHPLAGQLAMQLDWRELRFSEEALTTKEAQTRGKWEALVKRTEREGAIAGLPSAGLRTLERVNSMPKLIGEVVRQIES